MSLSRNGSVFYGYLWPQGTVDADDIFVDIGDLTDRILAERGIGRSRDDYRRHRDAVRQEIGVDFGFHGSGLDFAPYLCVYGTEIESEAGVGAALDPAMFAQEGKDWKPVLDRFMAEHGITAPEGPNQPGWWLAASAEDHG